MVKEYTGIDFLRIGDLGIFDFWRYLHDAVVWNCNETEEGRKYLENAYNYKQTKPDIAGLTALQSTRVVK